MPVLSLVLGWLALAAGPAPSVPAGYLPTGSPVELYDLGRLALLRDPRVAVVRFGPDGGVRPRPSPGHDSTTLMTTEGAGIIERIWFAPEAADRPAAWQTKKRQLHVSFGSPPRPVLTIALNDLFAGEDPRFPRPLVGAGAGGFVCNVPIAFRNGCTVTIDGNDQERYRIDVVKLPTTEGLDAWTATPTEAEMSALKLARALWLEPEALWSDEPGFSRNVEWRALSLRKSADEAKYEVDVGARSSLRFVLPPGPRSIRWLAVHTTPKTADAWRTARLRLVWESDDPAKAGVDLPMGSLFGLADPAERPLPFRSLLAGQNENVWYSQFPMPYRRQALLCIDTDEPMKGLIVVRTLPEVDPRAGYFRATERAAPASKPGADFEWLNERGRGHLAGVFLTSRGEHSQASGRVVRLKADDRPGSRVAFESWFLGAWPGVPGRLDQAQSFPLSGFPVFRREGAASAVAAYRWFLTDPVPFAHALAGAIEPGGAHSFAADDHAAAFWYSERPGPARPAPALE